MYKSPPSTNTSGKNQRKVGKASKASSKGKSEPVPFDGDALDALLEQKYANGLQGDENEIKLLSDNLELNDETFGLGNEEMDGEFDFGNQPQKQTFKQSQSLQQPKQSLNAFQQPSLFHQQQQLQARQPQRLPPHSQSLSLDQVEAQLRGGVGRPAVMNNMNQPMMPMQQHPMMMGGQMRSSHPMQMQMQMQMPMMPQQQFMMRPPQMNGGINPMNQQQQFQRPPPSSLMNNMNMGLGNMMGPPQIPQPIVVDGISVTPVEISNQEKDLVFAKLQVIQPMFVHIDTLMNTIYKIGGEKEAENLRRLNDVKNILRVQLELINRGIFVMRHETVLQIHGSLLQFFQYGETLMKNPPPAEPTPKQPSPVADQQPSSPNRPPSPKRSPSPKRTPSPKRSAPEPPAEEDESADDVEEEGDDAQDDVDMDDEEITDSLPQSTSRSSKSKPLKIIKKKKHNEPRDESPAVAFEEGDFPALGKISLQTPVTASEPKTKEPVIRLARGNQKQRREEKQKMERMGAASMDDYDSAMVVEDLSIPRHERYNGLMRKHEKELIAKIQISQLVSDDPFTDDFYFQMHSLAKKKQLEEEGASAAETKGPLSSNSKSSKKKGAKWQISAGQLVQGKTGASISNQMQQQMKRLIESRRALKPREGNLSLEGALGKIAVKNNRAPKQALEVPPPSSAANQLLTNTLSSMADLKCAEKIFDAVLAIETLDRKKVPEKGEQRDKWNEDKTNAINELWRSMAPSDEVPLTTPHPLVCSLNHTKGLRAAQRGLAILDPKQCLGFFSIMFRRLECLNVCNYALGDESEKVEAFMTHILPVFTNIVSEADMSVLLVLMRIILERHNLLWLAQCRVGLVLLTLILSRAELVKQNASTPDDESGVEMSMWGEVYSFMFSSFQGQFEVLFRANSLPDDQVYVWQFLSAMAVGASGIEQQKILVTEMRENIIQTAKTEHPKALENVNLFLNALGLNITASQLAAMG